MCHEGERCGILLNPGRVVFWSYVQEGAQEDQRGELSEPSFPFRDMQVGILTHNIAGTFSDNNRSDSYVSFPCVLTHVVV
jgi:hypothetical protein